MTNTGNITISRITGAEERIQIRMCDDSSGVTFATLDISLENYALLISGCSNIHGDLQLHDLNCVGKIREVKEELVQFIFPLMANKLPIIYNTLNSYEVDGWLTCSLADAMNHHLTVKYDKTSDGHDIYVQRMKFKRFVENED